MTREYPPEWLARMRERLGEAFPPFEAALSRKRESGLRVNPLRAREAAEALARYCGDPVPWYADLGRYVRADEDLRPGADIAHFAGAYYLQEPSAMAAVAALDPRPGQRALDLCAAPGGKSGQIALAVGEDGALVCNEPDAARARMLAGNLERLGAVNAAVVSARPEALARKWPETFDAVLCDAPCSGEGMFRRDPESRGQWSPRSAEGCAARQRPILDAAARMLRPGGRLVYSTCTFNERENEENAAWLLREHPELEPCEFRLAGVGESANGCLRLWPHRLRGEGHFVALFVKTGHGAPAAREAPRPASRRNARANAWKTGFAVADAMDIDRAIRDVAEQISLERLSRLIPEMRLETLSLAPEAMPDTEGLYCLRRGLPVCRVGASHIELDHSLAMALLPGEARASVDLSAEQAEAWLRGQPLAASLPEGPRWVWTHRAGLPLGWGRYSDQTVKNRLPKGLWRRSSARGDAAQARKGESE